MNSVLLNASHCNPAGTRQRLFDAWPATHSAALRWWPVADNGFELLSRRD